MYIAVNSKNLEAPSKMYTYGCTGATPTSGSGTVSGCTIHVNPVVSGGGFPATEVHDFLIHELTHCYLLLKLGGAYGTMPSWYLEGAPTWAMGELGNGSALASGYWQTYLTTPDAPLFVRAYSAMGYFVHLAETGTNVWHRLVPMGEAILSGGNAAGWAAADPTARFLDSWGSGYAEGRYSGAAWTTGGPNLPPTRGRSRRNPSPTARPSRSARLRRPSGSAMSTCEPRSSSSRARQARPAGSASTTVRTPPSTRPPPRPTPPAASRAARRARPTRAPS